ncbi:TonB family protein [Bradyrhizobium huanghuaihaiense]
MLLAIVSPPCWGQSDAISAWKQKVHLQLKSHARFPAEACGRSGEPKLGFALDRSGKVISSRLLSGSGVASIDAAALAAVISAQPFPPAPPELPDSDLSLAVVLVFARPPDVTEQDFKRSCDLLRDEISLRNRLKGVCRGC